MFDIERRGSILSSLKNSFEFIEHDMDVRVISVGMDFEKTEYHYQVEIDNIQNKIADEIDNIFNINQSLPRSISKTDPALQQDNYSLKDYFSFKRQLDLITARLYSLTRKLDSFIVSAKSLPKYKNRFIGKLVGPYNQVNIHELQQSKPVYVDLSEHITNLTSLCQTYNNHYLALDNYFNTVVYFDSGFNFIKSVNLNNLIRKQNFALNSNFYGIVTHENHVYINNMERNEILVLDNTLSRIIRVLNPVRGQTRSIFSLETFGNFLFVLAYPNKQLIKLDSSGVELETVQLETPDTECYQEVMNKMESPSQVLNASSSFVVGHDIVALVAPFVKEIHVYNMKGVLRCKLENESEKLVICWADNYLLAYNRSLGSVLIFDRLSNTDSTFQLVSKFKKKELRVKEKFSYTLSHRSCMYHRSSLLAVISQESIIVKL